MVWSFHGTDYDALEDALGKVNDMRQGELYRHDKDKCSALCKQKGKK